MIRTRKPLLISRTASIIVTLVGCLVLIGGWGLDLTFLKSGLAGAAEMQANTALCFILAGLSLGLQTRQQSSKIAQGCAIAILVISILTLSQYLFGWNLGIDQLLFQDLPVSPLTKYPGRMGDNTALNFVLISLALWLVEQKTPRSDRTIQIATVMAIAISLLAVIGHVYQVQIFYRFIFYSNSMTLTTALTFLILCTGILSIRENQGLMKTLTSNLTGGILARRLMLVAIALPFCLGWLILQGLRANLYDPAFSLALLVILLIFILILVIWINARWINQSNYDRNRSSDRLRSSEARFQRLASNIPGVLYQYLLRANGSEQFTYISPKAVEIYELTIEELQKDFSRVWQMVHPDDLERVEASNNLSAQDLGLFDVEFRLIVPSGQIKWVQARSQPERQENGDVIWDGMITDISDRKRAQLNEQFLKELDLRLRQLSDAEAMTWEAVSSLGKYLNVDRCFWHEIDWENHVAIVDRNWRREADVCDLAGTYPLENFFTAEQFDCLAAGQSIIVDDVATHPHTAPYAESYQPLAVAAFVAAPCIQLGRWVANLSINCTTVRNWREDEVTLLQETVARLWSIIEQTRALQALRVSEYQYRTLFETIDQGFCVCQMLFDEHGQPSDYRFLEVNSVFEQMTGLQEATGKTARELVPNLENFWFQTYGRVVLTGEPARFENQSQAMNRWFDVSAFRFDQAQKNKFAVLFTNITERKQAEIALMENNNILQAVINGTKDVIYVKDLQGRYILSNQAAAQWLNINLKSMMGKDDLALFPAEVAQRIQTDDQRVIQANESVIYEEQLSKGDELRSLITGKYPWRNERGEVKGIIGISRDVTDFKQAEADLQQRNQHIQILYETTRDLLSTHEPLTLIDTVFAKLKPLIGLDIYINYILDQKQENLQLTFYGGISDETARSIKCLEIGQAICGTVAQQRCQIVQSDLQQSTDPQTELVRSLGLTTYSCQALISSGKFFGTLSFGSRTRTDFTLAETKLFQAICDQMAIALERSELLSSLQQQTEELQQANRLKDEFLAALSHELRTPLNPILGWTKLLQSQKLTPTKTADALSTIERNVNLQIALVNDLLDVSRIIQGKFNLAVQPLDLIPVINAAIATVQFSAIAKSITLETHFLSPSTSQVMGDETRLQQVFWNLLANGIKFTPNGGRVDIWLEPVENYVQIRITDTGIGISAEFLPHVFDRFRQADGSSTRRYGGLGLGLSLVKSLVELHGGTVEVESPGVGQGATFKVNLPYLKSTTIFKDF